MKFFFGVDERLREGILSGLYDFPVNENFKRILFQYENIDEYSFERFSDKISETMKDGSRSISLLSDHGLLSSLFDSVMHGDDLGLVLVDSRLKSQSITQGANKYNYLRYILDKGLIDPRKVIIIGASNFSTDEYYYLKDQGVRIFGPKQIFQLGVDEFADVFTEDVLRWKKLLAVIDLSVLDSSVLGVNMGSIGGLGNRELIYLIQRLKSLKNFSMANIMIPSMEDRGDGLRMTKAKINVLKKLLSKFLKEFA